MHALRWLFVVLAYAIILALCWFSTGAARFFNPLMTPVWAPLYPAIIAASAALYIAQTYTKDIKRAEATLEFSKRYHEILKDIHDANQEFYFENNPMGQRLIPPATPTDKQRSQAHVFFFRLLDLFLNEYQYFKQGLIETDRFRNWMRWRWHDWDPINRLPHAPAFPIPINIEALGVTYQEGCTFWLNVPEAWPLGFRDFMARVHGGANIAAVDRVVDGETTMAAGINVFALGLSAFLLLLATNLSGVIFTPSLPPETALPDRSALAAICTIHLLHKSNSLPTGSLADYDREAGALLGIGNLDDVCSDIVRPKRP